MVQFRHTRVSNGSNASYANRYNIINALECTTTYHVIGDKFLNPALKSSICWLSSVQCLLVGGCPADKMASNNGHS